MSSAGDEDDFHEVNATMRHTVSELAEGFRVMERKLRPLQFWALTVLGIVLVACMVFGIVANALRSSEVPAWAFASFVFPLVMVCAIVPWTRSLILAAIAAASMREPVTLVRFSRRTLVARGGAANGEHNLDAYPLRIETPRLVVLAKQLMLPALILPKRIFTDPAMLRTLSDIVRARAPSAAVVAAVQTLGDDASDDALRYTPDPDEALSATLLMLRSKPVMMLPVFAAAALIALDVARTGFEPTSLVGVLILVPVLAFVRFRLKAQFRRTLHPVTLELNATSLAISSQTGRFTWPWADMKGVRENDKVIVLRVDAQRDIFVPKRVLSNEQLAMIRKRATPESA
jgi:hypothetical protein